MRPTDEPVFGGHLAALCAIEGVTVPRFVTECIRAIELKPEHMRMDGLYRASGNLSQVQRIRCEVRTAAICQTTRPSDHQTVY